MILSAGKSIDVILEMKEKQCFAVVLWFAGHPCRFVWLSRISDLHGSVHQALRSKLSITATGAMARCALTSA